MTARRFTIIGMGMALLALATAGTYALFNRPIRDGAWPGRPWGPPPAVATRAAPTSAAPSATPSATPSVPPDRADGRRSPTATPRSNDRGVALTTTGSRPPGGGSTWRTCMPGGDPWATPPQQQPPPPPTTSPPDYDHRRPGYWPRCSTPVAEAFHAPWRSGGWRPASAPGRPEPAAGHAVLAD
ncbi:hypothetical protein GCM10009682_62440 [Luedemannella flava]|uniref:Uncharacterized protein n=1 Tax=Luedemannella flava TaxID=349316 RepID=A0ABN2MSC9_9ACTN